MKPGWTERLSSYDTSPHEKNGDGISKFSSAANGGVFGCPLTRGLAESSKPLDTPLPAWRGVGSTGEKERM